MTKTPYAEVSTITSNEQHVRMRIYDGALPADQAYQKLLELERAQHEATRRRLDHIQAVAHADIMALRAALEKISFKASGGLTSFSAEGKHEFLMDIYRLCKKLGIEAPVL